MLPSCMHPPSFSLTRPLHLPVKAKTYPAFFVQNTSLSTPDAFMPKDTTIKRILVIGQGCEFDYSGVQACKALREEGR